MSFAQSACTGKNIWHSTQVQLLGDLGQAGDEHIHVVCLISLRYRGDTWPSLRGLLSAGPVCVK